MIRILITNDDGIHSDGLIKLGEALKQIGDVYVVAPASEMSGASHSLTLARPLRIRKLDERHWSIDGTPTDCVTLALGVSLDVLQSGLRSFPGLAHRMEQVGRRGNVLFVNDSKGTNADAAAHALSSFADIFWIAGGLPKAGGITGLTEYFPRIRKAYLIGEAAREFATTLEGRVAYEISDTLEVAIPNAARD